MDQEEIIRYIIDAFFRGEETFETNIGFVWVAKHGSKRVNRRVLAVLRDKHINGQSEINPPYTLRIDSENNTFGYIPEFETLTIEPKEGGQYEVAVRIWSDREWRGYKINNVSDLHSFYLNGVNTRGH